MVVGVRKGVVKEGEAQEEEIEGLMTVKVVLGRVKWRIVGVYMSGGIEKSGAPVAVVGEKG